MGEAGVAHYIIPRSLTKCHSSRWPLHSMSHECESIAQGLLAYIQIRRIDFLALSSSVCETTASMLCLRCALAYRECSYAENKRVLQLEMFYDVYRRCALHVVYANGKTKA